MSNHAVKPGEHKKRKPLSSKTVLVLVALIIVAIMALNFLRPDRGVTRDDWPSGRGKIAGTRIAVIGTYDRAYRPGEILYRAEAEVLYEMGNTRHDAWIPVSNTFSNREELQFWLSLKDPKVRTVRWNPKNPDDTEEVSQPRIES